MAWWLRRASLGHKCSVQDLVEVPDGSVVIKSLKDLSVLSMIWRLCA